MIKKAIVYFLAKSPAPFRDFIFSLKRYSLFGKAAASPPFFLSLIDGRNFHGGFADRMKGIISCFAFCHQNKIPFRIHYTFPFTLTDFLIPNTYDWTLQKDEVIAAQITDVTYLNLVGSSSIERLLHLKNGKKQVHCYANRDVINALNAHYHTQHTWGDLFRQLFRPAEILEQELQKKRSLLPARYIGMAFRFQNLLGDFQEYQVAALPEAEQRALMEQCRNFLIRFRQQVNVPILVTSDSYRFSQSLAGLEQLYCFPEQNHHLDLRTNLPRTAYLKSFTDFFLLSESQKVYAAGTEKMYRTEFPVYAARLNERPFERILIE
ncbi:hypothetical protein [Niabella sp.]|uniref:hypothetical protein n=1 Tax=Niabella sp. TaxID=1962976 RepID=UPI0026308BFE|nr:hypothetical protein [Niabella sp.]